MGKVKKMNITDSSLYQLIVTINEQQSREKSKQLTLDKQFLCGTISFYLKRTRYMLDWMLLYNPNSKYVLRFDPDLILTLSHDNLLEKWEIIEKIFNTCDEYIQQNSIDARFRKL